MRPGLAELAAVFLKLGATSFGGPAAHVAMMEQELVDRRRWLSRERFLDLLGATNMIPGPNSTEMAIHVGYVRGGWIGLVVAGVAFILPSAVIVGAIAAGYVAYGTLPAVAGLLYGVKPVVIAIVIQALARLGRTAVKSRELAVLGLAAILLALFGVHELAILALAGVTTALWRQGSRAAAPLAVAGASVAGAGGALAFGLWPLFLCFLKIGSVLFGSGYVLLAFLRADLVERFGWITESQLLDATAVGQLTPGPVSTTATFIGYLLGGPKGAAVATVGIFLPAFVFVAASGPLVPKLRRSAIAAACLDGVNVGALALMAVVTAELARAALADAPTYAIAIAAAVLLRLEVGAAWIVLGGAAAGLLLCRGA
jgi:chromate transporter